MGFHKKGDLTVWKDSFEFWYQHDVLVDEDWSVAEIEVKVHLEV